MKLNKDTIELGIKLVSGTAALCALYFGLESKLDKLESKIDELGMVSIKDKEIIQNQITALQLEFKEGKHKVNRELASLTDRVFNLYAVLPKTPKIEEE